MLTKQYLEDASTAPQLDANAGCDGRGVARLRPRWLVDFYVAGLTEVTPSWRRAQERRLDVMRNENGTLRQAPMPRWGLVRAYESGGSAGVSAADGDGDATGPVRGQPQQRRIVPVDKTKATA